MAASIAPCANPVEASWSAGGNASAGGVLIYVTELAAGERLVIPFEKLALKYGGAIESISLEMEAGSAATFSTSTKITRFK